MRSVRVIVSTLSFKDVPSVLLLLPSFMLAIFFLPDIGMASLAVFGYFLVWSLLLNRVWWVILVVLLVRPSMDRFAEAVILFPGTAVSINLNGMLNLLLIGYLIGYVVLNKRLSLFKNRVVQIMFIFLIVLLFSIGLSPVLGSSIREFVRIVAHFAIFILIFDLVRDEEQISKLFLTMIISSFLPIAFGIFQWIFNTGFFTQEWYRLPGTFWNPRQNPQCPPPIAARRQGCQLLCPKAAWGRPQ